MAAATRLTNELQDRIVADVLVGSYISRACERAGIDKGTFTRWMHKGDPAGHPDEPDLSAMALADLRRLCKTHSLRVAKGDNRASLAAKLDAVGAGSYDRYRAFRVAVEEAEAQLEARLIDQWQQTMSPIVETVTAPDGTKTDRMVRQANYQSIATFLARRFPARWPVTPISVEVSGPGGRPIEVTVETELAEALEAYKQGVSDGRDRELEQADVRVTTTG